MNIKKSIATGLLSSFLVVGAGAVIAPAANAEPVATPKIEEQVKSLQNIDFNKFVNDVTNFLKEADKDTGASKKMLEAYNKLSSNEKLVVDAENAYQVAAKKYGPDSKEAKAAKLNILGAKISAKIKELSETKESGKEPDRSVGSLESVKLRDSAIFSKSREDDPVWGVSDKSAPDPTKPNYKVTQHKEKPAK